MSFVSRSVLILRSRVQRGVSKDGPGRRGAWFETRSFAALLTMRDAQIGAIRHSPFATRHSLLTILQGAERP
jgi:hypothetical protein